MNEELLQEIKSTLPWLIVAALAVGGFYGVKNYRATRKAAATTAYARSTSAADLEGAVAEFGKADTAGALKVKLAKKYYDDGRFQEALDLYVQLKAQTPAGFEGIPAVGEAESLEALGRYDEAIAAYDAFVADNAAHPLAFTAKLGAARATALKGDKAKANELLKALKDGLGEDEAAKDRVEQLEDLVKRLAK